jgi:hypothetical protein
MNLSARSFACVHANVASARRIPSGTPYRENLVGFRLADVIRLWSRCFILSRNSGVAQSFLRRDDVASVARGAPLLRGDFLRGRDLLMMVIVLLSSVSFVTRVFLIEVSEVVSESFGASVSGPFEALLLSMREYIG